MAKPKPKPQLNYDPACKCVQRACQEKRRWVVDIPSPKCPVPGHKEMANG